MSEYNSDSLQELGEERVYLMKQREFLADKLREAVKLLDQIEGDGRCCAGYGMHEGDCPVLVFNRGISGWERKVENLE